MLPPDRVRAQSKPWELGGQLPQPESEGFIEQMLQKLSDGDLNYRGFVLVVSVLLRLANYRGFVLEFLLLIIFVLLLEFLLIIIFILLLEFLLLLLLLLVILLVIQRRRRRRRRRRRGYYRLRDGGVVPRE